MDIDTGSYQMDFPASPIMLDAVRRNLADGAQMSEGLTRYHSAPSSEITRFLSDDFVSRPSHRTVDAPVDSIMNLVKEQQCSVECRSVGQRPQFSGVRGSNLDEDVCEPLSAIFEHGLEESLESFCSASLPVVDNQQVTQSSGQRTVNSGSLSRPLIPAANFSSLSQSKNNIVRHSSSPGNILSRLVMEEISERPISNFSGSYIQSAVKNLADRNSMLARSEAYGAASSLSGTSTSNAHDDFIDGTASLESPTEQNRSGLLRQISSPAGLLSQLSLDGVSTAGEKLPSSNGRSSEEGAFDRGAGTGAAFMAKYVGSNWDEVGTGLAADNLPVFAQRKRGRGVEEKMMQGLMEADAVKCVAENKATTSNQFNVPSTTNPGSTASAVGIDISAVDSVLCRARAKRGCATHPRSIAERVRRTKISERMRKLQELVPNMDKQTNTADMLDEAVEYVKFLQRRVEELSKDRPKCNGTCQNKGTPLLV